MIEGPKRRFSASMLSQWMACPLQAKFARIDHYPNPVNSRMVFGTVVHHALRNYHENRNRELALRMFEICWEDPQTLDQRIDIWFNGDNWADLNKRGLQMISDYIERRDWTVIEHIASEHEFLVPFGEFELYGFVDEIEITRNSKGKPTLLIEDLKTGVAPTKQELRLNMQFTTYVMAAGIKEFWTGVPDRDVVGHPLGEVAWEAYGSLPRRAIWMDLRTGREIDAGERLQADYERMYQACVEIDRAITYEVFVPDISAKSCLRCPYIGPHGPCGIQIDPDTLPEPAFL